MTNRAAQPLRVRDIEISSPAMLQYALYPTRKFVNETVSPGQTRTITIFATAVTRRSAFAPSEPLNIRAIVNMEAGRESFREIVNQIVS